MSRRNISLSVLTLTVFACSGQNQLGAVNPVDTQPVNVASNGADDAQSYEQAQLGDIYNSIDIYAAAGPYAPDGGGITYATASASLNVKDCRLTTPIYDGAPGKCWHVLCKPDRTHQSTKVDVGAVTIEGGSEKISMTPDPSTHDYEFQEIPEQLWFGGEELTIKVEGNSEAGLKGYTKRLTVPEPITVTSPQFPEDYGTPFVVDSSKPFDFEWSGGNHGVVSLQIGIVTKETEQEPQAELYVGCDYPASAGRGSIPVSLLTLLPKGGLQPGEFQRNIGASSFIDDSNGVARRRKGTQRSHQIYAGNSAMNDAVAEIR